MNHLLKKSLAACLFASSAMAQAITITTPDGTNPFDTFDWLGPAPAYIQGFDLRPGMAAGTSDNFTLTYFSYATALQLGNTPFQTPNLRAGNGPGYEFTIVATLNEQATCTSAGCTSVSFNLLGGSSWTVYYQAVGDANITTGTGFQNGTVALSGNLFTGPSGSFSAFDPTSGSGSVALKGQVTSFDPTIFAPNVLGTSITGGLSLGFTDISPIPTGVPGIGAVTAPLGQCDPNTFACVSNFFLSADLTQKINNVPEPGPLALLGLGLLSAFGLRRRRAS